jgi:hypothetical protein
MDAWHNNPFMAENVARDSMHGELGKLSHLNFQIGCD